MERHGSRISYLHRAYNEHGLAHIGTSIAVLPSGSFPVSSTPRATRGVFARAVAAQARSGFQPFVQYLASTFPVAICDEHHGTDGTYRRHQAVACRSGVICSAAIAS
eukprot:scaffold396504_cov34-Prasinocladus_malaysianus.AAC.1